MSQATNYQKRITLPLIGLVLITILGFGLRYIFLQRMNLHVDEFISLLGIKVALDRGIPIYPSTVFEGKGIVFSYLGAAVSSIFSFSIENIRYLSLAAGILTIPLIYGLAQKLFNSRGPAFVAALLFAVHPMAVEWGARARMYSLATFFIFLIILVCWQSLEWSKVKRGYLFLAPLTVLLGLLTHAVIIINIPTLLLALLVAYWLLYKPQVKQLKDWLWFVIMLASIGAVTVFGSWVGRQPGEIRQWQEEASLLSDISGMLLELNILEKIYIFFLDPNNLVATIFSFIGLVAVINKAWHRRLGQIEVAAIFVYLQLIATFLILYILVPSNVRDSRHNFIVLLPFLIVSMAYGLTIIAQYLQTLQRYAIPALYTIIITTALLLFRPDLNLLLFSGDANNFRYDLTAQLIESSKQPGDQTLTMITPANYLFASRADFYTNQHKTRFTQSPTTGQLVDYYTGATYLATTDDFIETLKLPGRLWFAVDEQRFKRNLEPRYSQELLHHMNMFDKIGNIMIFVERDEHWAMAVEPTVQTSVKFLDQAHLVGYTPKLVGSELQITFFWQAQKSVFNYKVFVQLRDQAGNTVAQADFAPYDHIIHMKDWGRIWEDHLIRTGTTLPLSPEILNSTPDQYQLYIGLYSPEFDNQRVPVTNDISGENAVILTDFGL